MTPYSEIHVSKYQ